MQPNKILRQKRDINRTVHKEVLINPERKNANDKIHSDLTARYYISKIDIQYISQRYKFFYQSLHFTSTLLH